MVPGAAFSRTQVFPRTQVRFASVSGESDEDFLPKKKVEMDGMAETISWLKEEITKEPIILFMKGVPKQPMCGFSNQVVQILALYNTKYTAINVLADQTVRDGIKQVTDWPTIPQLFVNGEFIGGCDVVTQMHEDGDLKALFDSVKPAEAKS